MKKNKADKDMKKGRPRGCMYRLFREGSALSLHLNTDRKKVGENGLGEYWERVFQAERTM